MKTKQRKVSRKNRQEANVNFFLNSPAPTPISFFRLIHPTQRGRAIEKYKKCLAIAIDRSKGKNLDKLRALDSDEETIQRDWEIWLKERKAILACRISHDTNLQIQQDFSSTMKKITGVTESDIGEHSDIISEKHQLEDTESEELTHNKSSVPKKVKSETSNIDEAYESETSDIDEVYEDIDNVTAPNEVRSLDHKNVS